LFLPGHLASDAGRESLKMRSPLTISLLEGMSVLDEAITEVLKED